MKVKTAVVEYTTKYDIVYDGKLGMNVRSEEPCSLGLEDTLNKIGYENVLQVLVSSDAVGVRTYTVIYKDDEEHNEYEERYEK